MIMGNMKICRGCGAEILMIKTRRGTTLPVDPEIVEFVPDLAGKNLYVMESGNVFKGSEPMEGDKDIHSGYISHAATCGNRAGFRKHKARKKARREIRNG
jgi:hypothetical protein